MNATSLNIVQGTIQDARYMLEPVANLKRESVVDRIYNLLDQTTQSSFEAWEKSGKTEQQ